MTTPTAAIALQPLNVPLQGRALIEASAGTGKTYNLTALYVRLVLGQGATAFPDGLDPDSILVLTFTKAATQELRDRIRQRLAHAALLFAAAAEGKDTQQIAPDDQFLHELLNSNQAQLAQYAQRSKKAAQRMDLAAIYTIHSFCQRALKRFAFAAGQAFELELETDQASLFTTARNDYWRRFILPLSPVLSDALIGAKIGSPADLKAAIITAQKNTDNPLDIEPNHDAPFPAAFLDCEPALDKLDITKQSAIHACNEDGQYLLDWINGELAQKHLKKTSFNDKTKQAFADFIDTGKTSTKLKHFTYAFLEDETTWYKNKQQHNLPDLQCLKAMSHYQAELEDFHLPIEDVIQHAANWIDAESRHQLDSQSRITYDTMITKLAEALDADSSHELANQLHNAYSCTLIDEFQDTDQDQYRIFRHIYADRDANQYAWFMIGDPKQAIYSFRGADVHTYIQAKSETAQHYTLSANFRSDDNMVDATNQLFSGSPLEAETDNGVFGEDSIRFHHIAPKKTGRQILVNGAPLSAMTFFYPDDSDTYTAGNAVPLLAEHAAKRVANLLTAAAQGQAVIDDNGTQTTLRPADITLLVRQFSQADAIRNALAQYGIRSVYKSDRNSIYDSQEATDLLTLLRAIAQFHDGRLIRAALATRLLNYSWKAQADLQESDNDWQALLQQFRQFHAIWQQRGPLPMLHRLVHSLQLAERQSSERAFTNLFHLAELLQTASQTLDGMDALLHHLETAILDDTQGSDDNKSLLIRLESERELVNIMTLHKSKGLEFPLVVIPFATLAGKKEWETSRDEDMRLLYVGITRAAHVCWMGLLQCKHGNGKAHQLETGSLGRLLFGNSHANNEKINQRLDDLCASSHAIELDKTHPPEPDTKQLTLLENTAPLLDAASLKRPQRQPAYWSVTSYSGLTKHQSGGHFTPANERIDLDGDEDQSASELLADGIHQFPKGAEAGNLLHLLLEKALQPGFDISKLDDLIERHYHLDDSEENKQLLADWLQQLLTTPLQIEHQTASLTQLDSHLCESEFWLNTTQVDYRELDRLSHCFLTGTENDREPLAPQTINGLLKGFIDLTFCINNRYYVLDYKSNWLGNSNAAYSHEQMQAAMLSHRYDLQGLIYQQALHRLLQARLKDEYDPETHLGGCYFFFARGIESDSQGLIHLAPNLSVLQEMEALFNHTHLAPNV